MGKTMGSKHCDNLEVSNIFSDIIITFPEEEKADILKKLSVLYTSMLSCEVSKPNAKKVILKLLKNETSSYIFQTSDLNGSFFRFKERISTFQDKFKNSLFSIDTFSRALQKNPDLCSISIDNFFDKCCIICKAFGGDISVNDYMNMALKEPTLFFSDPALIFVKFEMLFQNLKNEGLTRESLLIGIKKQPQLLTVTTSNILKKFKLISFLYRKGLWEFPKNSESRNDDKETMVNYIFSHKPIILNFSLKNIRVRKIYAIAMNALEHKEKKSSTALRPLKMGTMFQTRHRMENQLINTLKKLERTSLLTRLIRSKHLRQKED